MNQPLQEDMDFLQHFGVKGMKWGVRKAARAAAKSAKADEKWEKNIYSSSGAIKVHNETARRMNSGELSRLNANPKYKNKNLLADLKLQEQYYRDYEKLTERVVSESISAVHGSSPSGKKKAIFGYSEDGTPMVKVVDADVKHASDTNPDLRFVLKLNELGQIVSMDLEPETLSQSSEKGMNQPLQEDMDFLQHAGVKGMKWGVRRQRRLDRIDRVAKGGGSIRDKASVLSRTAPLTLLANKGSLKKVAEKRSNRITARKNRIQKGEAKVTDLLAQLGTLRLTDLGPLDR